jgi:asparagine synthetase B (glutamine-hydrolysing)
LGRAFSDPPGTSIVRDARSGAVLLLEGEIFNVRELRGRQVASSSDLLSVLLEAYLSKGAQFVDAIDGEFNIVIHEPAEGRLSVYNDHVGSYPFYYWQSGSDLLVGSEKKCLLAVSSRPRKLDPVGLLQPFVHQHNLGERTLVEGLSRLRPSARLTYASGRLQVSDRVNGGVRPISRESEGDLLPQWEDILKSATAKRLAGKSRLLISLSAGQDSRAVACSIPRSLRPITARTWGHAESFEVRYARDIARALNLDHYVENPFDYTLSDGVRRIVWRTDGETDFRNGLSIFSHATMRRLSDDVIGGWLGDISSGAHLRPFMLVPMQRRKFLHKVFNWYIQHDLNDLKQIFTDGFLEQHWTEVRQAFEESYGRFSPLSNARAHEAWDMYNRQTRMTVSSMPIDSHLFGKVRPFFDKSYLEFTASIPIRLRIGQGLYKSLINRIGPEIRAIPNGNTNVRNHASPFLNLVGYGRTLSGKAAAKVTSGMGMRGRRPVRDQVAFDLRRHDRKDTGMRTLIQNFVASRYFDGSIFDRNQIERMLERHYSGAADHSELIAILATFAVALEYFVYERTMTCPPEAQPYL